MKHIPSDQSGFTLVELAIVLAIIGLLAGGIIGGQSLIRSSQVSAVAADFSRIRGGMNQFQQKYGYLPGDFPKATEVWGRADGGTPIEANCAAPDTTASPDGVTTCNGNGSGIMDGGNGENYRAWQHMAAAGYINGKFTGTYGPAGTWHSIVRVNQPEGPIKNSSYFIWNWGVTGDDGTFYAGSNINVIAFGLDVLNSWSNGGVLSAREAEGLDRKLDDGLPGKGMIRPIYVGNTNCTTSTSSATARYAVDRTEIACVMLIDKDFQNKSNL